MTRRLTTCLLSVCLGVSASVVRIHVTHRSDILDGRSFGSAGPYEKIIAKAHFEVDPRLPVNRIITDIDLAPVNSHGKVEFSADLYVLKPRDLARGNGTVLFEVCNRGRKGLLGMFSQGVSAPDPDSQVHFGDNFVFERGYTLAWLGWQFDVPPDPGLMRLYAPVARRGHRPITGLVRSQYVPNGRVLSISLGDRTMVPYAVADPNDPSSRLTVRDSVTGTPIVIPRRQWQFARNVKGKPVPDRGSVFMRAGFEPGRIYEIVYKAQDPTVVGLGPAAVRDFISFLKNGTPADESIPLEDQHRHTKRAIGFGTSQSGRFLRTFLFYGFNQDEQGRRVFDGIWAHVAGGGRGSFNHRFAQPSRDGHPFMNVLYPTDIFPFTDLEQTDPETRLTDGILLRAEKSGTVPRIFYTNSSYEYWGRAASLTHTDLDGRKDAPLAKNTRIYLFAGGQHSPGAFPSKRSGTRNLPNPNDYRWSMRALLVAMNRWVMDGVEPPPSRYPRISERRLVPLEQVIFPRIPKVDFPKRLHLAYRTDFGLDFRAKGIVTVEPPKVGRAFPVMVPQVDRDGNETSGIRLPEIRVPLATYTGWNLRDARLGAPAELYSMVGSFIPFAKTAAERRKRRDPRMSVEERYGDAQDYLKRVDTAADELVHGGYLLEMDVPKIVEHCRRLWVELVGDE